MGKVTVHKAISLTGHKDCVYTVVEAPDESKFISAGGDGFVVLWDIDGYENGQLLVQVPNSVYALCLLKGTGKLVVGQNYEGIHIIDIEAKKELSSLKLGNSPIFDIHGMDNKILVGTGDGTLFIIDQETLTVREKIKTSSESLRTITSNDKVIVAGYSDNHIRVFERDNYQLIRDIKAHDNSVFSLCYSSDGRYLISGGRDARLKIWDVSDHYRLHETIIAHLYTINSIDFSPDGRLFASASMDKTIKIWDRGHFKLLKVIDKARHGGHLTSVNKLFWSSCKNKLISCSDDRSISIWDIEYNSQP